MLRPQGYITIVSDGPLVERDTVTCGHCNRVVMVKPRTAATVYLIPQFMGPDKEVPGAGCRVCMRAICLACCNDGNCKTIEARIEEMEARGRFLKAAGL